MMGPVRRFGRSVLRGGVLGATVAATHTAALAVTFAAAPAAGQSSGWGLGAGAALESYSFSDAEVAGIESLSLLTIPFAAEAALHPRLRVRLGGAWARGTLTYQGGASSTVSGPVDTSLGASWTLGRDRVVLSGTAFVPTGAATHTAEEAAVAGAIASDLLPFRITNWGTGGGGEVSVAVAAPFQGFGLGGRVGYRLVAEYEPLEDAPGTGEAFRYDPGDLLHVRLAADRNLGRGSKLSLVATWQTFGEDASRETNLFRTGDRLQVMGSLAFPWRRGGSGWVQAGLMHRSAGSFLVAFPAEEPPSQQVVFLGAGALINRGGVRLLPGVDLRVLRTADGLGQGWTVGLGGSAEIPARAGPRLVPTARARFGSLVAQEGVETGFVGFEIGLSVRRTAR